MFLPCFVGRLLFFLSAINAFCADLYIASARDAFGQAIPAKATSSPSDLPTTIHQQQSPQLSPKSELVADALIIPRSAKDAVLESGSQSDVALESGSQSDAAIELGSESDTVLESVDPGTAVQTGVCERMLLVSTLDGRLSAVDAVRGRLLWSVGVAGGGMFQSSLHPSAGVVPSLDGRLFRWQDGALTQLPVSVQALLGSSRQAVLGPWQRGQLLLSGASSVSTFGVELRSGRLLYRCETEGCRTVGVGRPGESVLVLRQHRHVLLAADPLTGRQRWNVSVAQHEVAMAGGEDRDLATSCGAQQQFGTAVPEGKVWTDQEGMRWSHQFSAPLVHAWSVANGISQPLDLFIAEKGSSASPADLYFGVHRNQMYVQSLGRFSSVEGPSAMTAASFAISGVSQERSQQLQRLYTDQAPVLLSDDAGFLLYATECDNPQLSVSPWPEQRPPGQAPPAGWGLHVLVLSVTATVLANLLVTRRMRAHYQRAAARAIWNFVRLSLPRIVLREAMVPLDVKEAVRTPDRPLPAASSRSRYLEEFEPLSCLGSGGYGVVFEARNMLDDQRYAVKRTRLPAGARQRRRVLREVACLARLEHTNIVRYFNCWTERLSLEDVRLQDAAAPRAVSPSTGVPQSSQCDSPTPASCPPSSSCLFVAAEGVAGQWKHRTLAGARSPGLSALHSLSLPPSDPLHSDGVQFLASGDDRSAGGPARSSSSGVVCRSEGDDSVVFEAGSGHVLLDMSVASESSSHSPLLAWQSHCGDEDDEEEESGDQAVFLFIQVQLCRPETLRHWLQSTAETRTRSRAEALRIFLQIIDGVDHLHSQQLMHRDLKPSNIFFALDGVVKIGDFGLATPLGDCGRGGDCMEQGHTDHVGTRLYMSPEQAAPGARLYDWRVDVFALGLLLLEMLVPFSTGAERVSVLTAAREGWLPKPLAGPDNVSGLLVSDMTAHLPQQRPSIAQVRLRCSQIQCCAL